MSALADRICLSGVDEIPLVADSLGAGRRGVVLLAHGAGQTRRAWAGTASRLAAEGWRAVALDLRGHGDSGWAADGNYRLERFAGDLARAGKALSTDTRRPHLVGASLGGLAGLMAETHVAPGVFASLTLVDITPRMEASGVERVLAFMADRLHEGFDSVEDASGAISTYLPHRTKGGDLTGLAKNLRLGADGRYRWHWDPRFIASVLESRNEHNIAEFEQRLGEIELPLHLIRGRMSDLVSEDNVRAFLTAAPRARFTDIAGASHMVAGDRNDAFCEAVLAFLNEVAAS